MSAALLYVVSDRNVDADDYDLGEAVRLIAGLQIAHLRKTDTEFRPPPLSLTSICDQEGSDNSAAGKQKDNDASSLGTPIPYPIIFFAQSGGSELVFRRWFISIESSVFEHGLLPLLLFSRPLDNSSAATNECEYFLRHRSVPCIHCKTLDQLCEAIEGWEPLQEAVGRLRAAKLGLFGQPSFWLINEVEEDAHPRQLPRSFPEVIRYPLEELKAEPSELAEHEEQEAGLSKLGLKGCRCKTHLHSHVEPAARLYDRLSTLIRRDKLTGVSVECFNLLMSSPHYAACAAFAKLNADGVLAACEGELSSLVGMVFLRECQSAPCGIFMANFVRQGRQNPDKHTRGLFFAHCTAPLCGLGRCWGNISSPQFENEHDEKPDAPSADPPRPCDVAETVATRTHYETKDGLAVTVSLARQRVIGFKLRPTDGLAHLFTADITSSPLEDIEEGQCRTQMHLEAPDTVVDNLLGNHYLFAALDRGTGSGEERGSGVILPHLLCLLRLYGIRMICDTLEKPIS